MTQQEVALYVIKLALSGVIAFLAIALWSKTRDGAWLSLVSGCVTGYAALVYELLVRFGIVVGGDLAIYGIPFMQLVCTVVPLLFFILALVLKLAQRRLL